VAARSAVAVLLALLSGTAAAWSQPPGLDDPASIALGALLYREGLRADHSPLQAERDGGVSVRGREAACIQCHRASGMGGAEGSTAVPPVIASVLFSPGHPVRTRTARVFARLARQAPTGESRPAYAMDTLQRALNDGIGADGQTLDLLMPRYKLTADEVRALAAYTTTMHVGAAPGLQRHTLHLATIETADATAAVRQAGPELLAHCLAERSPQPTGQANDPPVWALHRWTLGADPQLWPDELAEHQRVQPVFAIVSGTTGTTGRGPWQAVQRHCEREAMPCVLPNTTAVDDLQPSDWTFHFSRGASLDAAAMADTLAEQAPAGGWRAVHLVVDPHSEAARIGARRLTERMRRGFSTDAEFVMHRPEAADTTTWLAKLGARDALALWLPAATLQTWTARHALPPGLAHMLVSGELIELEAQALAPGWRALARITWPYDSAERHLPRIASNVGKWLDGLHLPLADSAALIRLQGHTYSACEVAANALRRMGSRVSRAFLVELLEGAEEAATATAYPRFTLGPGRRHGSHGTRLMRFSSPLLAHLEPASEWFVPD
jgi:mono/diheme cytochrome c family protein